REKAADGNMVHILPAQLRAHVFGKTAQLVAVSAQCVWRGIAFSAQRIQKLPDSPCHLRIHGRRRCLFARLAEGLFFTRAFLWLHDLVSAAAFLPRGWNLR